MFLVSLLGQSSQAQINERQDSKLWINEGCHLTDPLKQDTECNGKDGEQQKGLQQQKVWAVFQQACDKLASEKDPRERAIIGDQGTPNESWSGRACLEKSHQPLLHTLINTLIDSLIGLSHT